jgi:acetyl-CoA carboxylase carboxyl transferase subunit alpha
MLDAKLTWHLNELKDMSTDARLAARREKFRNIAQFYTT